MSGLTRLRLRGAGCMQGRAQVGAGDVGDHRVGGAGSTIAGHAGRHVLRLADGAQVVDERVADRGALGSYVGRRVVGGDVGFVARLGEHRPVEGQAEVEVQLRSYAAVGDGGIGDHSARDGGADVEAGDILAGARPSRRQLSYYLVPDVGGGAGPEHDPV